MEIFTRSTANGINYSGLDSSAKRTMTNFKMKRTRLYAVLCIAICTLAAGNVVQGDGLTRVDRSSSRESGELDRESQQAIVRITGFGNFLVRTVKIHQEGSPLGRARVFHFFTSPDALRSDHPLTRIFSSGDKAAAEMACDSEQLVGKFLEQIPDKRMDGQMVSDLMPEIVLAAVYANQAELLHSGFPKFEESKHAKEIVIDPGRQNELRALGRDPLTRHKADGGLVWEGRYLLRCGSVEDVAITISSNRDCVVKLRQLEVAPRNYFRNRAEEITDVEEWVVSNESTWRPSKRLSFTFTLASLGSSKAKYQLGLALMDEHDDSANAEGIKWLRAAAADGYRDAVASLALFEADSRSSHDRESARKDSCCRIPR